MGEDSDVTMKHEEWFGGGRGNCIHREDVGIGAFLVRLSVLGLLDSKASYVFEIALTHVLS